jgi:hypothetical protein
MINRRVSGRFGTLYKTNQKYDPLKKIGNELESKDAPTNFTLKGKITNTRVIEDMEQISHKKKEVK